MESCKYVNGITIFPKLPVDLKTYHKARERNNSVAAASQKSKSGLSKLNELNKVLSVAAHSTTQVNDNIESITTSQESISNTVNIGEE